MKAFGFDIINPFRSKVPLGFYDPVKGHTGIDMSAPDKSPIDSPVDAEVWQILKQTEMGLTLYLYDKKRKVWSVFSHLSTVKVKLGDMVQKGSPIALTGNSGTATTGPHLHYETISETAEEGLEMMTRDLGGIDGYNIDPVKYLDEVGSPEHWSDADMDWAMEHGIITYEREPEDKVLWGEYTVTMKRLAERILDWSAKDTEDIEDTEDDNS
jgi:murein DD-endopeptidase MepM/ murein hydrolase activator NlpD